MSQTKYPSVTTPDIQHNAANMITELILINREGHVVEMPWRGKHRPFWGKTVSAVTKLIRDFHIDPDQLAFYVYRCEPTEISTQEFAKAAVVAKKLFQKFDLYGLVQIYQDRFKSAKGEVFDSVPHKPKANKKKSLMNFLKELENASA